MFESEPSGPEVPDLGKDSMTRRTLDRLRLRLNELGVSPQHGITPRDRWEDLIPLAERRRIWNELAEAGLALPTLVRSPAVFMVASMAVLLAAMGLARLQQNWNWLILWFLVELALVAARVTRPLAVHVPSSCETIREAVLHLTPFSLDDYREGLWPSEDIADKIRLIIANAADESFDSIRGETRLLDLFE